MSVATPRSRPRSDVLLIDNYDSFTYNLVEYVSQWANTDVVQNTISLAAVRSADPDAIVISPGPGHPKNERDVGVSLDVLREISTNIPTLGVCLGLQTAIYAYGGTVDHAPYPVHGMSSSVVHDEKGVFAGIEQGFEAGRYHSLLATDIPDGFEVSATTESDSLVMGIRHQEYPIECVQFHPESILTTPGHDIIRNFLQSLTRMKNKKL